MLTPKIVRFIGEISKSVLFLTDLNNLNISLIIINKESINKNTNENFIIKLIF